MNSLVSMYCVYINDGIQTQRSHSTRVYPNIGRRLQIVDTYTNTFTYCIRITRARCVKIVENPLDKWKNRCDSVQPGLMIGKLTMEHRIPLMKLRARGNDAFKTRDCYHINYPREH